MRIAIRVGFVALAAAGCAGAPPPDAGARDRGGGTEPAAAAEPRRPADPAEYERTFASAERCVDEFASLAADATPDGARRRALARSTLEAFAAEHVGRLLEGARDEASPGRRRACLALLGFSNDRRATAVAVDALSAGEDPALRTAAAFCLALLADPDTPVTALVDAARSEDADVRMNALLALRSVFVARPPVGNYLDVPSRDEALPVLEAAMFDPEDAAVRAAAVRAAAAVGDPGIVASLVHLLRDEDPVVRRHTAAALARYGRRPEVQPLLEALDTTADETARAAIFAALQSVLERERIRVPDDLPAERGAWQAFADREFAAQDRRPLR